jgi:hypothetical protein
MNRNCKKRGYSANSRLQRKLRNEFNKKSLTLRTKKQTSVFKKSLYLRDKTKVSVTPKSSVDQFEKEPIHAVTDTNADTNSFLF